MNRRISRRWLPVILMMAVVLPLTGQESGGEDEPAMLILPLTFYHGFSFGEQHLHSFGGGGILSAGEQKPVYPEERDSLQAVFLYARHRMEEELLLDFPGAYNSVEFLLHRKRRRHQYFSLLKTYSDVPVAGGLDTFAFVSGYGYEFIRGRRHSLAAGASLAVSDWGLELPGGGAWPVLPLPFLHYDYTSRLMAFSFDFTTSPLIDLVLFPQRKLRLNGSCLLADLQAPEDGGIKADASLEYRFFHQDHPWGDVAGIKAGYMMEDYEYALSGREDEILQFSWRALYGTLDLSLLEVTGGYAWDGKERYNDDVSRGLGEGVYIHVQLLFPLEI